MIVCVCNNINEADVRRAVRAGAPDAEGVYAVHGCTMNCGCCLATIEDMLTEERSAAPAPNAAKSRAA